MKSKKHIKVGVVGYGPAFNMGKWHFEAMKMHEGLIPDAVCDVDPKRLDAARQDFPGIETYTDLGEMLRKSEVQLLTIILPHNLHAKAALQCLEAGRHVVVEKPFALTVEECDRMIAAAKKNRLLLSCYHNRHWDANIVTIMKHLPRIGRPFRWESYMGNYSEPGTWWRSDKKISGGLIYDWGAHFTEWMLQVMSYKMREISGYAVKEVWTNVTNEDDMEVVVRFSDNAMASHTASSISAASKPMIRILGTKGAIVADFGSVAVHSCSPEGTVVHTVPMEKAEHAKYYENVRDHLLRRKPLVITPEWARRVIQVLDYAGRSAKAGKALPAKYR